MIRNMGTAFLKNYPNTSVTKAVLQAGLGIYK